MDERKFNLTEESWIRVMLSDCRVREVSLADALMNAHLYKSLAGEMEAQNVAVLRLLIAIIHTIFTRIDLAGNAMLVEDEKAALERWNSLYQNGCFPGQPIQDYFSRWKDRFWLFDEKYPFYQVPEADIGTENTAAKLNGEVSESNNKVRLFSFLSAEGKQSMSFSEGARWLLFMNGFDDCAAKQRDKSNGSRSMTVAWLGKLGLVTAVGDSLFESILLNMPMLVNGEVLWEDDDLPVWEKDKPCAEERRIIPLPKDLASLFTLQSRRILLIRDADTVTGYKILGGDAFSEQGAISEPMTLWRYMEDKKTGNSFYLPRRHERTRQVWRDFGAMVNWGEHEIPPGVVTWCRCLQQERLIPSRRMVTFRVSCVRYDSSQSSSITDSFSDALSFHANLLLDAGFDWIQEINRQVTLIEKTAGVIGNLAVNLAKACGQRDESLRRASDAARETFYGRIDIPFRDWLLLPDPNQESEERLNLAVHWQEQARRAALTLGRQLVDEKGDVAYVGRKVTENKKERHYSSPEAYRWFKRDLEAIYPYTEKGDDASE